MLIDNEEHNVETWRARGGRGYLFRGEAQFERDLRGELRELAASAGVA